MRRAILLVGMPGAEKTALTKRAVARINAKGGGFHTEEMRTRRIGQGFRIVI